MKKIDQWQTKDYGNNGRIKKTKEKGNMTKNVPISKVWYVLQVFITLPNLTYPHYDKRCPCTLSDFTRF